MKRLTLALRTGLAGTAALAANAALASGPSGTDSVTEISLTGNQLLLLGGGAALLGITLWLVIRLLSK